MITDTIDRINTCDKLPKHPFMKAYWGHYKLGNWKKRLIKKILG